MKNGIKKLITFVIAAAMLSAGAYAEEAEGTVVASTGGGSVETGTAAPSEAGDIEKYFAENGYPDYVAYIFNAGCAINGYDPSSGEEYQPQMTYLWEVGAVNATAAQKDEIQALIDGLYPVENKITFVDCAYSHGERLALIPEIRDTAASLCPDAEAVEVAVPNSPFIWVEVRGADDTQLGELQKRFGAAYGELIIVSDGLVHVDDGADGIGDVQPGMGAATEIGVEEIVPEGGISAGSDVDGGPAPAIGGNVDSAPTAGVDSASGESYGEIAAIASPDEQSGSNAVLWICIAAALVVALGTAAFIFKARLIPVFATSDGGVTAKKLTRRQTEEAVKNGTAVPDESVLQAIREKIDK